MLRLLISLRKSAPGDRRRSSVLFPGRKQNRLTIGTHLRPHSQAPTVGVRPKYWNARWNSVRLLRVVGWIMLGCCLTGCTKQPGKSDYHSARVALEHALEFWKLGNAPSELRLQSNIVAGDPEWESGIKLKNFVIDDEAFDDGRNFHFKTILELVIEDGDVQKRESTYIVATDPVITVFRDEM